MGIINDKEFYQKRKNDILNLANSEKDGELLNVYAYLQSVDLGKIPETTDKKGWKEYKDERFAISYFVGLASKSTYDNPELAQALLDFPNSAKIQWVKLNCAVIEKKDYQKDLVDLIKKEFKTLGSDTSKFSYNLKNYFYILENGI